MEGIISNFRMSKHVTKGNSMVVKVEGVDTKEKASEIIGKKAVWTSPAGKKIEGEVRGSHGNKGALRVNFNTGMPGQSLGSKVQIN